MSAREYRPQPQGSSMWGLRRAWGGLTYEGLNPLGIVIPTTGGDMVRAALFVGGLFMWCYGTACWTA